MGVNGFEECDTWHRKCDAIIIVLGVPSALSPLSIYFVFDTCFYVIFDLLA